MRKLLLKLKSCLEQGFTLVIKILLGSKSYSSNNYYYLLPENLYHPTLNNNLFKKAYDSVRDFTIVSKSKYQTIFWALTAAPPGDFLDIGVLKGGSSIFASIISKEMSLDFKVYSVDDWKTEDLSNRVFNFATKSDLNFFEGKIFELKIDNIKICNSSFENYLMDHSHKYSVIHFDIYSEQVFERTFNQMFESLTIGGVLLISGYGALSLEPLTNMVNTLAQPLGKRAMFIQEKSGYGVLVRLN